MSGGFCDDDDQAESLCSDLASKLQGQILTLQSLLPGAAMHTRFTVTACLLLTCGLLAMVSCKDDAMRHVHM